MRRLIAFVRLIETLSDYAAAYLWAGVLWLCSLGALCARVESRRGRVVRLHGFLCRCGGDDNFQE